MKFTKIDQKFQKRLQQILDQFPVIKQIVDNIDEGGGTAYLVGGAVRDLFLNLPIKDIDIEVHGVPIDQLEELLRKFGPVNLVGKSFGVLRIAHLDVDWSVPRADSKGRKPIVQLDPFMSMEKACARRDVTMNAMGINLKTFELIDPYNGREDLQKKILRSPDATKFIEDPLRFFRVMQFVGRFGMQPDEQLNQLCKEMDIAKVSKERIEKEFEKLLLKSEKPSLAIDWLNRISRLAEVLPELYATKGVEQDPSWHPEGDVFEHTKQTLDAAAQLDYDSDEEKLILMYAALCHDLGKVSTTEEIEGELKSLGHAKEGEKLTKQFLRRITGKKDIIAAVAKLVKNHMHPIQLVNSEAKLSAYKRLARKLAPEVNLHMLWKLALLDKLGRNPEPGAPLTQGTFPDLDQFLQKAEEAEVLTQVEEPILYGRDLMPEIQSGPKMGELVKEAYRIQIEEDIKDKEELKKRVLKK